MTHFVSQLAGLGLLPVSVEQFFCLRTVEKYHKSGKRMRPTDSRVVRLRQILINDSEPVWISKEAHINCLWCSCLYSQNFTTLLDPLP